MSGGYATLGAAVDRLRYHKRLGRRRREAPSAEEGSKIFPSTGMPSVCLRRRVCVCVVCVWLCVVSVTVASGPRIISLKEKRERCRRIICALRVVQIQKFPNSVV